MKLSERCLRLSLGALERPRRALLLWTAVTLLPLPGLFFLRVDTDGRALVPRRDPAVLADAEIRERFHLHDLLVVHVRTSHPDGIFNPATLRTVRAISEQLRGMDSGLVTSLATEKRDRLLPGSSSSFVTFLEPLPVSVQDMKWLRSDLSSPAAKVYEGVLVSRDRRSLAILVDVPSEGIDRRALYRSIRKTLVGGDRISLVGAPAAEALLGDHILRDLALMIPLSVLLIGLVLWIGTRRVACVAIALGKAAICIVWTFAVLACFGIPVYLTTAVLPVVLATMAMSDEIHLLIRFQREPAERTLQDLVTPVVLATTTTGIGFLSFVTSPIAPVRAFGLGAALGIAWGLGFSLLVTPALMGILPESWIRRDGARAIQTGFMIRRPAWTLGLIAIVTLVAGTGLSRLTVHDSWIESFAEGSEFRRQTADVNRNLNGTHLLHVHLPFRSEIADPEILKRLGELETFLRGQPQVGGVLGLHSQLTALSHFWIPGVDPREILSRPREVRRLLNRYELSPGLLRRRQVVTDSFDETVVTVFLRAANYRDTRTLMSRVETWHRERLAPLGAGLGWAGDVAVSQATIPAIVRTQTLSLPIALLGVFLVIALLYGSARLALAALFPVTLSAVWLLGALGWLGIPLGVATSMFFAIALGLGVDSQSIHFLDGWRRLRDVRRTVEEVGPAIALNTAAVAAGFGLLAVSSVPANARLGLLIALALVLGGILTLSGLGSLLELGRINPSSGKEGVMIRRTLVLLLLALVLAACPAPPPPDDEAPATPPAEASPSASASPAPAEAPIGKEPKSACQQTVEKVQAQMRSEPPPRSFGFPHTPEMEFENSLITFRVCKVKKNLTPEQERRRLRSKKCCDPEFYDVELVKLDAYMRLCREEPVINELGFREMRFTIEKWELFGRSNLYDADIVFSATPGVVQPKSLAFAPKMAVPRECLGAGAFTPKCRRLLDNVTELSRSDFPALIVYNAIYDVYVNDKKIVSQEPGVAMARGAMQIPPTGITVAFQKPIDVPGVIKICPGTCSGMVTIPESTFNAGLDTARKIKAGQMRLDKGFVPQASQRQPTIPSDAEGTPPQ